MTRVIYEIVNPSDAYTMVADDRAIAAAAVLLLGRGQYALDAMAPHDAPGVPIMMFSNEAQVEQWFRDECGTTLEEAFARKREIADALDTVLIGRVADRQTYDDGLALIDDEARRQEWREKWLDRRRSSLNNIGGAAAALARSIREGLSTTEVPT